MKSARILLLGLLLLAGLPLTVQAASVSKALLIGGTGGSDFYTRDLSDWVLRLREALIKECGFKAEDVVVLLDPAPQGKDVPAQLSSLDNVTAAFEKMKTSLKAGDQFFLFLSGHGHITEPTGKLCLPGPDLSSTAVAGWLDLLPTQKIIVVHAASASGLWVKDYAKPGRVIISSCLEAEGCQGYFAEFFVRAIEGKRADTSKDGKVDLLEAYLYSTHEMTNWYHRQYLTSAVAKPGVLTEVVPEAWLVKGQETRAIWKHIYEGSDKQMQDPSDKKFLDDMKKKIRAEAVAEKAKISVKKQDTDPKPETPEEKAANDKKAQEIMEKKLAELEISYKEDTEPIFGDFGPEWYSRRMLAEHAQLHDMGPDTGFVLWKPYEFEKPPPAEAGQIGHLAKHTILGQPGE